MKQAARTLGIHYQTAYKLVRSGRLAAVRVGGAYDVSEAAIAAYLAEKEAVKRVPVRVDRRSPARALDEMIRGIEAALDTPGLSAQPVLELVAEALALHLGDVVVVQLVSADGQTLIPGPVRHVNPRRRAIAAAYAARYPLPVGEHPLGLALTAGETVVIPHVAQDGLRARVPPELIQHLDEGGVHSFIAAPATSHGEVLGVILATRDAPGRPYTDDDGALVSRLARLAGTALARGRLADEAHRVRNAVMQRLASGVAVDDLVDDGPMAQVVCDAAARVVAVNDAALALGGVSREETLGRELSMFTAPAEREHQTAVVKRLLVGELPFVDVQRTLVRRAGHDIQIAAHHGAVRDIAAEPLGLVVVAYELP